MPDDGRKSSGAARFAAATQEAWEKLALKAAGVSDLGTLATTTADGLKIAPLYGASDAPDSLPISGVAVSKPAIRPLIAEPTPEAAKAAIRAEITGGADEVVLQIEAPGEAGIRLDGEDDLAHILDGIDPGSLGVHLRNVTAPADAAAADPILRRLAQWWNKSTSEARCTVGFGIDTIAGAATGRTDFSRLAERALAWDAGVVSYAIEAAPDALALKASGLPYHESGASEAQELGVMLAAAIACLRACEMQQITPQDAASRIELELAADAELFLTIAKLRAARLLWARLGEECSFAGPARLGVQTSERMMCVSDPQTNMVRTSIAALGAGIGGADALTILPFTHAMGRPDAFARRIARNTAHILNNEARIGEVADAAAGSWAIESFTHALCEAAWNVFTEIEDEGGVAQSLLSGSLQSRIAISRTELATDIDEGRRVLVGATDYKPESVPAVTVEPWFTPPQIDGPVPTLRPIRLEGGV